jgi:hypothetical protein
VVEGVVPSSRPAPETPSQIAREFRSLREGGARVRAGGTARQAPEELRRYTPHYKIELGEVTYYLSEPRQNPDVRFFVAYVRLGGAAERRNLYARIFYKDVSLVWRSASHVVRSESENWIGKGEARWTPLDGDEVLCSAEETTDLPLEIQSALEGVLQRAPAVRSDHVALLRVLRRGGDDRIQAFRDFTAPRERARANPENLVNGGRKIAWFERPGEPESLVFEAGFEPDFEQGVVERSTSKSHLYGGRLRRFRIAARNRRIQYLFMAAPRQAWIIPPQTTSLEITSYGVRAIDVAIDEEMCVPGYEYHFLDESEDPPVFVSQIPKGFAGPPSPVDPDRSDASRWIERLPIVREFRQRVLGAKPAARRGGRAVVARRRLPH